MKCVLTVVGNDKPGIIAKVSTLLAEKNVNIEDISQTIMQKVFTMIMIIDLENCSVNFSDLTKTFNDLGEKIGVNIHLQNQEVFDAIHDI